MDMEDVSATLGHRQYWFTADTYTVGLPEIAEAVADASAGAGCRFMIVCRMVRQAIVYGRPTCEAPEQRPRGPQVIPPMFRISVKGPDQHVEWINPPTGVVSTMAL
ncbi:hypothetical protein AB0B45_47460 [Nonomuraea sp. NPDC049152]|uniref:hypothetical protein n=1 Tax=Nonomuraea sp. NPDC049152 TaxID=3154350 RepID=UPI0033C4EEBF